MFVHKAPEANCQSCSRIDQEMQFTQPSKHLLPYIRQLLKVSHAKKTCSILFSLQRVPIPPSRGCYPLASPLYIIGISRPTRKQFSSVWSGDGEVRGEAGLKKESTRDLEDASECGEEIQ